MATLGKRPRLNGLVNRIKLVGIELEGGWDIVPSGESVGRDGSVKFPQEQIRGTFEEELARMGNRLQSRRIEPPVTVQMPMPAVKGEIVSKPLPVDKIAGWVTHCYPKYVNETCGLHVHMSFHHRINYSRLMCPEFTPFIVAKVKAFAMEEQLPKGHPQWPRVNRKDHPFCAHLYLGEGQVKMTKKDYESRGKPYSRYTFVNYCEEQHHTLEVRGLSMYDEPKQAIRAIMAVVSGTNEFLSKLRHRERPERATVKPRPESRQEFRSYLRAA